MNNSLNNELNYKTKKIYNCLEIHLTKTVCMSGSKSVKQTSNKRKPEICLEDLHFPDDLEKSFYDGALINESLCSPKRISKAESKDQILNGSINKINTVPKKFSIRNCGLNKGIAHQIRKTKEQIVPESPFIDSSIYNCKNKVFIVPETPMVNFINENNKRLVPKTPMIDFNEEPKSIFVAWENPIVNSHNGARRFIVPETPLVDFNSEKKKFY
ncbi:uncharacterized protein LOC105844321 [Hydra vulgaris]|uniref:uncharacterized protein LOC105844321 n=1 Tax=Hydra vulgaris TaxID=6087 RepID=UPI001F5EFC98|nr:uncharacterized protein LOC105844321 isoform X1 [Hydra vulgaris]